MADIYTRQKRSEIMMAIRGKQTTPEKTIKRLLRRENYKYRCNVESLPGKPDIVLLPNKIIFVHGCFWHRHVCTKGKSVPSTNMQFWKDKFNKTVRRDRRITRLLRTQGWSVLSIWECETASSKHQALMRRIQTFLRGAAA